MYKLLPKCLASRFTPKNNAGVKAELLRPIRVGRCRPVSHGWRSRRRRKCVGDPRAAAYTGRAAGRGWEPTKLASVSVKLQPRYPQLLGITSAVSERRT